MIQGVSKRSAWLGALLLLLLLALLAFFVDWGVVVAQVRAADYLLLILATLCLLAGFLLYAVRWWAILSNQSAFMATFHAANAGSMANALLPLRPGDAARIFLLGHRGAPSYSAVTSSIVVERWFEQIMRLAAFGGALVFGAGMSVSATTILGSVLFLVGSFLLMIWMIRRKEWLLEKLPPQLARLPRLEEDRARRELASLIDGLAGMSSPARLAATLFWSALTWSFFWGFHYLCLAALHQNLSIQALLGISLGSLALAPPSATTLPGLYQASIVAPLAVVGYDAALLTSYTLIMHAIELLMVIALGLWSVAATEITLGQIFGRDKLPQSSEISS